MLVLMCRAGEHRFAINAIDVAEVVPFVELTAVPGAPDWMAGVFAYRGRVLSVLDLVHAAVGMRCPTRWSSRIVIVRWPGRSDQLLGVLAEQVTSVQCDDAAVDPSVGKTTSEARLTNDAWHWGTVRLDAEGMFRILNLSDLLTPERQAILSSHAE